MKKIYFFVLLYSSMALATPIESNLSYQGNTFSYYINHSITETNNLIEEAVIVVHGSERNADTYFNSISTMADQVGKKESTIIISPHFKLATDPLLENELNWTDEGWLRGDTALINSKLSSFQVIDHLIDLLLLEGKFPNLKNIIITGHSAGGQLTQRYALGSQLDKKYSNIHFRYLVLNPGSYVYLDAKRPIAIPNNNTCSNYNDYKYGLDHLNTYMSSLPINLLVQSYLSKDIIYFLGEKDILSDDIDQDCPAQLQGINRLERGKNFKENIDREFSKNNHQLFTNPNIGHTEWGMYSSELGKKLLFNF